MRGLDKSRLDQDRFNSTRLRCVAWPLFLIYRWDVCVAASVAVCVAVCDAVCAIFVVLCRKKRFCTHLNACALVRPRTHIYIHRHTYAQEKNKAIKIHGIATASHIYSNLGAYLYICVYIYIWIYIYIYMYMYICIYVYMHMYISIYRYMYIEYVYMY